MYKNQKISLVIPCLNEEKGIVKILGKIPIEIDEVIVVDNGSSDNTSFEAKKCGAKVIEEKTRGCGIAYRKGSKEACGDVLLTLDGDCSYSVADVMVSAKYLIDENLDLVWGNRLIEPGIKNIKPINRFGNWFLTKAFNFLAGSSIRDSQSGLWAIKREALSKLELKSTGFNLPQEIKLETVLRGDMKYAELDIGYYARIGDSKLRAWKDGTIDFMSLIKKRFEIANK